MKSHEKTLKKIREVNGSVKWNDVKQLLTKMDIKFKNCHGTVVKSYIRNSVWTTHLVSGGKEIEKGSVKILKDLLIKENYLDN